MFNFFFPLIQFDRYVEVFGYHYLHTQEDFLSDVGGFLGLFLGLSIFAVISLALDVAEKGKGGDGQESDTSSSGRFLKTKLSEIYNELLLIWFLVYPTYAFFLWYVLVV